MSAPAPASTASVVARLPSTIRATTDAAEAADGADIVVLAVPSQTLRANLAAWGPALPATGGGRVSS